MDVDTEQQEDKINVHLHWRYGWANMEHNRTLLLWRRGHYVLLLLQKKAPLQDYEGCCGSCVDLKWLIWQQPGQQLAADIAVSSRAEAVFGDHVTFLTNLSQEIAGCSYEHSVLSAEKHSEATSRRRCSPKKKMGKDLLITSHQTSKCTSEDLFVQNF